jgi:hypothetical protein
MVQWRRRFPHKRWMPAGSLSGEQGNSQCRYLHNSHLLQSALARPLSSSLQHYQLVLDRISTLVEQVIWSAHSEEASNPTENSKDGKGEAQPIYGQETAPPSLHSTPSSLSPSLSPDLGVKPGSSELNLSKEAVQEAASKSTLTVDSLDSSFHQPQGDQPSPYLQKLCPLCFNFTFDKLKEILKGVPNAALSEPAPSSPINPLILPCCFQAPFCCFTLP